MATNRFERPRANQYNFQQFVPNFEAWDGLAGQIQGEYNQFETLAHKTPNYIQSSETDRAGADEYSSKISGIRDGLVDAFMQGGQKGRAAMNAAQFDIMEEWTPGGLANQLESRLSSYSAETERIKEFYEDFGEVTPYTMAQQAASINPLRSDAGDFQDVGSMALVNPYSTEDVTNWINDHEKMIHETLLNNNLTRRYLTGNEFESVHEVIRGAKGKDKNHIFKVLADAMPDDMKRWFQYKHNARSFNSEGQYQPGDQMTMYTVEEVPDGNGNMMRSMAINQDSELAQTLWAVANGAAYIDPISDTYKLTDWRKKKLMEINLEHSIGFNTQGPAVATNTGGVFNGATKLSEVNDTVAASALSYQSRIQDLIKNSGFASKNPAAAQQVINNVMDQLNSGNITQNEAVTQLQRWGGGQVDSYDIEQVMSARQRHIRTKAYGDYVSNLVQNKTGIDIEALNQVRDQLGADKILNAGGVKIAGAELIEGLSSGKYQIVGERSGRNIEDSNYKPGSAQYYNDGEGIPLAIRNTETNEQFKLLGDGDQEYVQGLTQDTGQYEALNDYLKQSRRVNQNVTLDGIFEGQYVETPDAVSHLMYRDPVTGEVNNKGSKDLTKAAREYFQRPNVLNNYTIRSATDFNRLSNFSLESKLGNLPVDEQGRPDGSQIDVQFLSQPIQDIGYAMQVGWWTDADGNATTTNDREYHSYTIPAPAEIVENITTGGRGYANLNQQQQAQVGMDYSFNSQMAMNNQMSHRMGGFIPKNKPLEVPVFATDGKLAGHFVYSADIGTGTAALTDQGGSTQPRTVFRWVDENGAVRIADPSSQEARLAFYSLNQ